MPRPLRLAGREALLAGIEQRFREAGTLPAVVVLHGLGGVGKTSTALEYAYRHRDGYRLVWQFAAEDEAVLSNGLSELALLLGVRGLVDGADPAAQVHAALAAHPGPWLLVLDNVTDPGAIRRVLPPAGHGHVLITSRYAHWPPPLGIEVHTLEPAVAAAFLRTRTGDDDPEAAAEVARELGLLPLALEQAAAYTLETGRTLGEYLALLRRRRTELLSRGRPWEYDQPVSATWTLALERLAGRNPEAIAMLRFFACLAPDAIPLRLLLPADSLTGEARARPLLGSLLDDEAAVDDAVRALRAYSLIRPVGDGSTSVHRLVRFVVLDQVAEQQEWRAAAAEVLAAAVPEVPEHRKDWPVFARLLPHVVAGLDPFEPAFRRVAEFLAWSGDYPTSRLLHEQVLTARLEHLGPDHPDTLWSMDDVAFVIGLAGDFETARERYADVLEGRKRVLGVAHEDTLTAWDRLAFWTGKSGDAAAARDLCAELLPLRERVSGPEHPETLQVIGNLAWQTGEAGDAEAARDRLAALVPVAVRVYGADRHDTLTIRANHAHWSGEAGDPAVARDLLAAVVRDRDRVSGPEHPETLIVRSALARWTGEAGDPGRACELYEEVLPVRIRVQGRNHADVRKDLARLAHFRSLAGR
jgi:hypothetical protein